MDSIGDHFKREYIDYPGSKPSSAASIPKKKDPS